MDQDENRLIAERRGKLHARREHGNAFPNDFRKTAVAAELACTYGHLDNDVLEERGVTVSVAGRMMAKRVMGKASFVRLNDVSGDIQLFLERDRLADGVYRDFKTWDVGDIVGATGTLFKTRTGELTVRADDCRLLTKSLRPLPEKYHGLADTETRYRQRYLDLIMSEETREVFRQRSRMISLTRQYLDSRGFLEVETPMMQVIPGGANARPFVTHHNALGLDMYLRIAPELFLKRLVVGGFERVYEINRNFRNEGLSTRHNPEFTMLELYRAYADYGDMMDLTEELVRCLARGLLGQARVTFQGTEYDLRPAFRRASMEELVAEANPDADARRLRDPDYLRPMAESLGVRLTGGEGPGKLLAEVFEKSVEPNLGQPVFVTGFPAEVSPLARARTGDDFVTDRFELFLAGREIANGFSELNDPEEQAARFRAQVARKTEGDEEAMFYDADYVRALEYGLPPTGGLGVGMDRLAMFLTDSPSIRDVLLFPHMRPESDPSSGTPV